MSATDDAVARYQQATADVAHIENELAAIRQRRASALEELQDDGRSLAEIAGLVGLSKPGVQHVLSTTMTTGKLLREALQLLTLYVPTDLTPQITAAIGHRDRAVQARRVHLGVKNLQPGWERDAEPGDVETIRQAAGRAGDVLARQSGPPTS